MDDRLRRALLGLLDVDVPVVIGMRHEPDAASARLLVSLGAGWVVDGDAPPCVRRCRREECRVSVGLPPRHPLSPQKARALARASELRNGSAGLEEREPEAEEHPLDEVTFPSPEATGAASATPAWEAGRSPSRSSNPVRVGPSEQITLDLVAEGLGRAGDIAATRDINVGAVSMHLSSLHEKGLIRRVSRGLYELEDSSRERAATRAGAPAVRGQEGPRSPTGLDGVRDDQAPCDNGTSAAPNLSDDFPDETKDAYATALIAAARCFADTLEEELALL